MPTFEDVLLESKKRRDEIDANGGLKKILSRGDKIDLPKNTPNPGFEQSLRVVGMRGSADKPKEIKQKAKTGKKKKAVPISDELDAAIDYMAKIRGTLLTERDIREAFRLTFACAKEAMKRYVDRLVKPDEKLWAKYQKQRKHRTHE